MILDAVPAVEQACDVAEARVRAARLDDEAFAAMRAATEAVDAAARRSGGGNADQLWADYKRLRLAAAQLREQPCATASADQAPPPVIQVASPQPESGQAEWRGYGARSRFRIEGAISTSDRQPTAASRLAVQHAQGYAVQYDPTFFSYPSSSSVLPPAPTFATPSATNSGFSSAGITYGEGPQPEVRSWSNGLDLALNFAPQGLDAAGWRLRASVAYEEAITKSTTAIIQSPYTITGASVLGLNCYNTRDRFCQYTQTTPVSKNLIYLPPGVFVENGQDYVRQNAKTTDVQFNVGRQFGVSPLGVDLRVRLGAELGVGWWSVREREIVESYGFYRDIYGPTFVTALTAGLGGDLWGPVRWSVDGSIGRRSTDLTYQWHKSSDQTVASRHELDAGTIGGVTGRLDLVHGPWNAFISADRRRDLSISSSLTGLDAPQRYSVQFPDGTWAGVWQVYSSRVRVGVGYSF